MDIGTAKPAAAEQALVPHHLLDIVEPDEDFTAGRLADREAEALLRLVEAVAEVEVGPAVGGCDGLVHLDVEVTKFL